MTVTHIKRSASRATFLKDEKKNFQELSRVSAQPGTDPFNEKDSVFFFWIDECEYSYSTSFLLLCAWDAPSWGFCYFNRPHEEKLMNKLAGVINYLD